jgi:hypothetical protein
MIARVVRREKFKSPIVTIRKLLERSSRGYFVSHLL